MIESWAKRQTAGRTQWVRQNMWNEMDRQGRRRVQTRNVICSFAPTDAAWLPRVSPAMYFFCLDNQATNWEGSGPETHLSMFSRDCTRPAELFQQSVAFCVLISIGSSLFLHMVCIGHTLFWQILSPNLTHKRGSPPPKDRVTAAAQGGRVY